MFNFNSDASYKRGGFFKTLTEKDLKFVLSKEGGTIVFNPGLILLSIEVNSILKEQNYKKDVLVAYSTSHIKLILALSIKVVASYMQALIVQVRVSDF